ncbi:major facilitator superfamily domain-containing protein [Aspergillus karnatakaensis]|uniref:putative MFS transporter n=1 Tax=Aspergillus karnatakaensis TaxID=1810916 RepID=UPI003CCDE516
MASESTPLLPSGSPQNSRPKTGWFLFLLCTVVITIDFGGFLSVAPQTQILENIICRDMHPNVAASSSICKDTDVQSELALITGWKNTFDQLPAIVLALPYGFLADRIGRKRVVMLSLLGLLAQETAVRIICWNSPIIPPRAIWLTSLFQICGGGSQIAISMVYTMLIDVYTVEERTNKIFIATAAALTSEILASPVSSYLMRFSNWFPYMLSLLIEIIGVLAALGMPETMRKGLHEQEDFASPSSSSSSSEAVEGQNETQRSQFFETYIRPVWTQLLRIRDLIWKDRNILAICCAFFVGNVGSQALLLMIQYVSKRFGWSMAEAGILISLKGIITLVLLLVILPLTSTYLSRRMSPPSRDLLITRFSAVLLVLGCMTMALAPTAGFFIVGLSILALGSGFIATLRGVASALVSEEHVGLLNTSIALVQGAGGVVAGPALAGAFNLGMKKGGVWIGLPYFVAAGLFAGVGIVTGGVRVVRRGGV